MCHFNEFSKIKGSICNFPIAAENVYNILLRRAVSIEFTVVEFKWDLICRGQVYFKPTRPRIIYQALAYLKSHNKFCEDISIAKNLSSEEMTLLKFREKMRVLTKKLFPSGKK